MTRVLSEEPRVETSKLGFKQVSQNLQTNEDEYRHEDLVATPVLPGEKKIGRNSLMRPNTTKSVGKSRSIKTKIVVEQLPSDYREILTKANGLLSSNSGSGYSQFDFG